MEQNENALIYNEDLKIQTTLDKT